MASPGQTEKIKHYPKIMYFNICAIKHFEHSMFMYFKNWTKLSESKHLLFINVVNVFFKSKKK